jgi:hypothetical protein
MEGKTMARKTTDVTAVKENANRLLANSSDNRQDFRNGVIALVETVLLETGNYHGFKYLPSEFDTNGILREDYDPTRVEYY